MHVFLAALFAAFVFVAPASSQSQRAIDMRLVDSGFKMRPAVTPQQIEHVRKLPSRRFVPQTTSGGQRYYIYADPDDCKCVFVGDDVALKTYRDMTTRLPQPDNAGGRGGQPPDAIIIHEMNDALPNLDLFSHPF